MFEMFQIYFMTIATLLGLAEPSIPATFRTDLPEAQLGDLRLRDGESVKVVAQAIEDRALLIEIRSRGKSLYFEVENVTADGFERPADKDLAIPVRGTLKRKQTDLPTAACATQKAYNLATPMVFVEHPECNETVKAVEATFTLEFAGVGRIETGTALISK